MTKAELLTMLQAFGANDVVICEPLSRAGVEAREGCAVIVFDDEDGEIVDVR